MQEMYHPGNHVDQQSSIGERNIEDLLNLMEKKKIKEVYSVFHLTNFFGIPGDWFSLHEKDDEVDEIEFWAEYKHIDKDGTEHLALKERGIEVKFYEELNK